MRDAWMHNDVKFIYIYIYIHIHRKPILKYSGASLSKLFLRIKNTIEKTSIIGTKFWSQEVSPVHYFLTSEGGKSLYCSTKWPNYLVSKYAL